MGNALVWFRNDLRLLDNDALRLACERHQTVKAIVVRTPKQWLQHDWSAIKWDLYERRLCALADDLASLGIELTVFSTDDYAQVPELISQFCHTQKLDRVFWNRDYPLDELNRDAAVDARLRAAGIDVVQCDSNLCVAPEQIKNGKGEYYRVFTPFFKAWLKRLAENEVSPPYTRDALLKSSNVEHRVSREQPLQDAVPVLTSEGWSVSESDIRRQTQAFVRERVSAYKSDRDRPAIDGTSILSAYFEIGVISPRVVLHLLQKHSPEFPHGLNQGMHTWLSEIAWREFYQHLMFHEPRLSRGESFVAETDAIKWRNNAREFKAWCEGTTGFPIVDAGMRQLNATGWMHNRVRMIVASFLVKDLHIDWRWGERYFMQRLIDGSFPANNGGWQWSAGTGTDAAPYFRVFNPARQSEKFDPDGEYIRKWIKELEPVPTKYIHEPASYLRATYGDESPYPQPIVDHSERREQFIAMFKAAKG
ncbi:MAG: deoxyribodipyrimidine photo-lyase [Aliidiomarina sp.]|uniref:deoxyribodipyrimidine photo-lyase n=1 Tax=Aliidiomarina sp. TaxID=1872439 RepID=UPI0025BB78DA|nr:deoxyribodipyrimidine photo-lyase [Aliidiomarina sp.]MCH8500370.1 deoxyribodipyrimidine photo-lyase [Aliidiomarina sp.]